jgi:hypothetical protein
VHTSWFDAIMWGRKARFFDDRGRPARLLSAAPLQHRTTEEHAAKLEARKLIARRVSPAEVGCFGLLGAYIAFVAFAGVLIGRGRPRLDVLLLAGVAAAVGLVVAWSAARVNHSRRISRDLLFKNICPQCGYFLNGIAAQPDGCLVCPECEAAWRA